MKGINIATGMDGDYRRTLLGETGGTGEIAFPSFGKFPGFNGSSRGSPPCGIDLIISENLSRLAAKALSALFPQTPIVISGVTAISPVSARSFRPMADERPDLAGASHLRHRTHAFRATMSEESKASFLRQSGWMAIATAAGGAACLRYIFSPRTCRRTVRRVHRHDNCSTSSPSQQSASRRCLR